jgi:hypothetical protein
MFRYIFLLLLVLCFPHNLYGAAGTITDLSGSGVLERDTDVIIGDYGIGVESMDVAVTESGKMRIDFIDNTRVDLTEHTRLLIDEFVYDPNSGTGSLGLRATLGTIRYASGKIATNSRQRVNIRTPSAKISVRGTDFIMVVDEIGGSMITLLPSCDIDGYCVTGEILVETDTGFVIMTQAFQSTIVKSMWSKPLPPITLDISEGDINNLLMLRKKSPYEEEEQEIMRKTRKMFDFLDIDFLEFDDLDQDALTDDIKNIWVTELHDSNYYLQELLYDMLDQLNLALAEIFRDELDKQNEEFFVERVYGYDETTRIAIEDINPMWRIIREDAGVTQRLDLKLHQENGYTINVEQGDEAVYDYRLGVGTNTIDITQSK